MGDVESTRPLGERTKRKDKAKGGTEMRHVRAKVWSDRHGAIQKHARAVREPRMETLTRWQKLANAATVEPRYQPPEAKVRAVKATFATARLASKAQETGGLIQLLFDSFSQPFPAGTRSAATRVRQMLYRAVPYQVDLQIEWQEERNRLIVTGQLLDVNRPEIIAPDVQVTLSNCGPSVVTTVTNQFGEFRGDLENSGDLDLSFLGQEGKPIVILLRGVMDTSS
jgi:hypothetical protein